MKTVYPVNVIRPFLDEGKPSGKPSVVWFEDIRDAEEFIQKDDSHSAGICIRVWERGEYSPEVEVRQKALAKLTEEEKVLLGLIPEKLMPEKNVNEHTAKQIEYASKRLKEAEKRGLIPEVMVYALKAMQERKGELFIGAAIDAGCEEWDV